MSRAKLMFENFFIYGIGSIISKLIPFVMLPIITRLMPNTYYFGLSDMCNTVNAFGFAIAVFGMYDALCRMFFDFDSFEERKMVCSTALIFNIIMTVFIVILLVSNARFFSTVFFGNDNYFYLIYICALNILFESTSQILSAPIRMQNKRKVFLFTNIVGAIISYVICIPLLLMGFYIIALPLAVLISVIINEGIYMAIDKKWFSFNHFDYGLLKKMLKIAIPLCPNLIAYSIFNSSDRIMITHLMGVEFTGIYAVGAKLGHLSQLIYTAFLSGWQYFSFSTMKDSDQVYMISKVFEYFTVIIYFFEIIIILVINIVYKVLFTGNYFEGAKIAPYLFLAPLLSILIQITTSQFIIIKKTWPSMILVFVGAMLNLFLNYFLIPILGMEGAAIATVIGYSVSTIMSVLVLKRMKLITLTYKFLTLTSLFLIYLIGWQFIYKEIVGLKILFGVLFISILVFSYFKEFKKIVLSLFSNKFGKELP